MDFLSRHGRSLCHRSLFLLPGLLLSLVNPHHRFQWQGSIQLLWSCGSYPSPPHQHSTAVLSFHGLQLLPHRNLRWSLQSLQDQQDILQIQYGSSLWPVSLLREKLWSRSLGSDPGFWEVRNLRHYWLPSEQGIPCWCPECQTAAPQCFLQPLPSDPVRFQKSAWKPDALPDRSAWEKLYFCYGKKSPSRWPSRYTEVLHPVLCITNGMAGLSRLPSEPG